MAVWAAALTWLLPATALASGGLGTGTFLAALGVPVILVVLLIEGVTLKATESRPVRRGVGLFGLVVATPVGLLQLLYILIDFSGNASSSLLRKADQVIPLIVVVMLILLLTGAAVRLGRRLRA